MPRLLQPLTQALAWLHRWVGIVAGLVVILWFLSAFTMMYAGGMPTVTPQERLDRLPTLDLAAVKVGPAEAAASAGLDPAQAGAPVLFMLDGRPAWRFPGAVTVYADDTTLFSRLSLGQARAVAARFLREPAPELAYVETLDSADQWTLGRRMPLEKFVANDSAGTQVYVSAESGEVVVATTRRERALAWLGAIPHWLYFDGLRQEQAVWYRLVVTLSAIACVLAVVGMLLAILRWRPSTPFRWSVSIPFRGGMRWHYIAGAIFGVFVLTWSFSGLASMEPWDWMNVPEVQVRRDAFTGGDVDLARFDPTQLQALAPLAQPRHIKEISLQRLHGEHYWNVRTSAHADARALPRGRRHASYDIATRQAANLMVNAATLVPLTAPFTNEDILPRLRTALPEGVSASDVVQLGEYDSYYYSRSGQAPLPVLRVKLDDPLATWLYIDPATSALVGNVHRYSRVERWVYNGLHSLDFRFWYSKRPLWDIAMILLLAGGLATSILGWWLGVRRLIRRRP